MSRISTTLTSVVAALIFAGMFAVGDGPESAEAAAVWIAANDPTAVEANEAIEFQLRVAQERGHYRSHLTGLVIDGKLAFAVAADEFHRLNQDSGALPYLHWRFPGRSDEELAAWNVIEYVRGFVMPDQEKSQAIERLNREFEARFGRPPCGPF